MGILFSLLYAHAWYAFLLKRKICKEWKKIKNQNTFKYGCKRVSRRCEDYMVYLKGSVSRRCGDYIVYLIGDNPYQIIIIVCECSWFSYIIIFIWWDTYAFLQKFHTQHINSLLLLILLYRYNVIWSSQEIHVAV